MSLDKLEKLRDSVPFLKNFSNSDLNLFLSTVKPVNRPPGYLLYAKGDVPDCFHVIIKGEIEIYIEISSSTETKKKTITKLSAGDLVGEMGFAMRGEKGSGNRTASARTISDVILFEISEKSINDKPELMAAIYRNLTRALALKLAETNKLLYQNK
ncbi:MAG: cyclic nucleotide-binding domain-containing protein [Nitrospinota bacterium]|nr:cyclic nucleotide-binding domain-containing protein [Nitrospinota bacterium]